jgi:hypothetical protein
MATTTMSTEAFHKALPHGIKREPEDDLASEQRLAKRFNLLNLGTWTIESHIANHSGSNRITDYNGKFFIPIQQSPPLRRNRSNAVSDTMNIDESPNRVFIHDLEEELAEIESDEDHPIFIPDIERRLNRIPKSLLRPNAPSRAGNEVVLYGVPTSLSIPKEQDNVRKAIIESRQRAQQRASKIGHYQLSSQNPMQVSTTAEQTPLIPDNDPDAMDIS